MSKVKKLLETAERANDPWFKDYWRNLADWLADRHESIHGYPLVEESDELPKQRVLH